MNKTLERKGTLAEVLLAPPGTMFIVLDLFVPADRQRPRVHLPEILLHCEKCAGERNFNSSQQILLDANIDWKTAVYACKNCNSSHKRFALEISYLERAANSALALLPDTAGIATKIGEAPPFGPPTPPKMVALIGPDRELFLKGRRAEVHGLGIGAFAYYRRVVERQKDRLFDKIIEVAKKCQVSASCIEELKSAKRETQFHKALAATKDVLPQALLIDGHNPLLLLHKALSRQIHDDSDEDCLALATSIREVLCELAERMALILKDHSDLKAAVANLLQNEKPKAAPAIK